MTFVLPTFFLHDGVCSTYASYDDTLSLKHLPVTMVESVSLRLKNFLSGKGQDKFVRLLIHGDGWEFQVWLCVFEPRLNIDVCV